MTKYWIALLFTEYPKHQYCSYRDAVELIDTLYGVTVTIEDICKLYVPYEEQLFNILNNE